MNDVATLLNQGIDVDVVAILIENSADLRAIGINVEIILDAGIRVDLVNEWLSNETDLNDAITIVNQGVDLNLIGTSSEVGGFIGLMSASPNEVISRIPAYAKILPWKPGKIKQGMRFKWADEEKRRWEVEMHGQDIEAPKGSNAAQGWVVRIKRDNYYMDGYGNFYKQNWLQPTSSKYNPADANATHISIQAPSRLA